MKAIRSTILSTALFAIALTACQQQKTKEHETTEVNPTETNEAASPETVEKTLLVKVESANTFEETLDRLDTLINSKGLTVFSRIDHHKGAEKVGMTLRPTSLIIFGNPKIGTKMMLANQETGIDLPLKFLVWEDEAGKVFIGYYPIASLLDYYHIEGLDGIQEKVSKAMSGLANKAAGKA